MKINDIRPVQFDEEAEKAALEDAAFLVAHQEEFMHVSCPACGADLPTPKYEKRGIQYVDCTVCTTLYVNPRPSPTLLKEFYATSKLYAFWAENVFVASEAARREKIFKPRVDSVLSLCNSEHSSLLEVGAAYGTFCEEFISRNKFSRVVAVEPVPSLAAICRSKGIEVIENTIEDADITEKFDVVVHFETIEHLFSPHDFLVACSNFLNPGGLMLFTCPNGKGFNIEELGITSQSVDHEHLNYFNPTSVPFLAKRCGFDVVEITTPGKLDAELVRREVLNGKHELDNSFLKTVLIDQWVKSGDSFQQFLSSNGLSSSMWIVLKKSV